jgi:hypothetical protein
MLPLAPVTARVMLQDGLTQVIIAYRPLSRDLFGLLLGEQIVR